MRINDDLSVRTVVHAARLDWNPSPTDGVDRRMLFRIGDEKARATSIVRYAPEIRFPRHVHTGGEEFLVLEGVFQDESGDFPEGSYVRNPPGTGHAPGSDGGCTILVKLWQFRADDADRTVRLPGEGTPAERRPGVATSTVLFDNGHERVMIENWAADATVSMANPQGLEMLVLAGSFSDGTEEMERWTWLRLPAGLDLEARIGPKGARVWYKVGPLLQDNVVPF